MALTAISKFEAPLLKDNGEFEVSDLFTVLAHVQEGEILPILVELYQEQLDDAEARRKGDQEPATGDSPEAWEASSIDAMPSQDEITTRGLAFQGVREDAGSSEEGVYTFEKFPTAGEPIVQVNSVIASNLSFGDEDGINGFTSVTFEGDQPIEDDVITVIAPNNDEEAPLKKYREELVKTIAKTEAEQAEAAKSYTEYEDERNQEIDELEGEIADLDKLIGEIANDYQMKKEDLAGAGNEDEAKKAYKNAKSLFSMLSKNEDERDSRQATKDHTAKAKSAAEKAYKEYLVSSNEHIMQANEHKATAEEAIKVIKEWKDGDVA